MEGSLSPRSSSEVGEGAERECLKPPEPHEEIEEGTQFFGNASTDRQKEHWIACVVMRRA